MVKKYIKKILFIINYYCHKKKINSKEDYSTIMNYYKSFVDSNISYLLEEIDIDIDNFNYKHSFVGAVYINGKIFFVPNDFDKIVNLIIKACKISKQ